MYCNLSPSEPSKAQQRPAILQAFISMVVNDPDALAMEFGFTPPSTTLKALSLRAAGEISYPSTMQAFIFESSTNAYGGMATNVQLGGIVTELEKAPNVQGRVG